MPNVISSSSSARRAAGRGARRGQCALDLGRPGGDAAVPSGGSGWTLSWRRTIAAGRVLLLLACLGLTGCTGAGPAPVAREPETGGRVIVVSVDTWHAMIAFPLANGGFEEWGYAERAWYLERGLGVVHGAPSFGQPRPWWR